MKVNWIILKTNFFDEYGALILLCGLVILVVLSLLISIVKFIKRQFEKRREAKSREQDKQWANAQGLAFFQRMANMIQQNQSQHMSDHPELQGMQRIDQSSLNARFEVKEEKFSLRFWYAVSVLHDRFDMENKVLMGKSALQAEQEEGINLMDDEKLYEKFEGVEWYELKRSPTRSFGYHGLGIRIPLGGGMSYRIGQMQRIEAHSKEGYVISGKGILYVTNQRMIFLAQSENKVIGLNAILDIEQYKDAVVIGKSRGKKPLIRFEMDDAALFSRLMVRLFQNV
jgi:hypothetical protein